MTYYREYQKDRLHPVPEHLVCMLDSGHEADSARFYSAGYNYDLLKRFALDNHCTIEILPAQKGWNVVDSLLTGAIDMAVESWPIEAPVDSLYYTEPIDSISTWVIAPTHPHLSKSVNHWLKRYNDSPLYEQLHRSYTNTIADPYRIARRGLSVDHLSPYDSLIIQHSKTIGWDWRLLAALIYTESHFRIEVHSHKGAAGLMQLSPITASRYEIEDILDPEENIIKGVDHIRRVQRSFRRTAAGDEELCRITLAAYNAGVGHIRDAFAYASQLGENDGTWSTCQRMFEYLSDSTVVANNPESIKCGTFKGVETSAYVDKVLETYEAFKKIIQP